MHLIVLLVGLFAAACAVPTVRYSETSDVGLGSVVSIVNDHTWTQNGKKHMKGYCNFEIDETLNDFHIHLILNKQTHGIKVIIN